MALSLILPMTNGAVLRARFFESHGVTLESQVRSRSGVRDEDGVVVFAMPLERVSMNAWGCSCLLWAEGASPDDAVAGETLNHCKLAVQQGLAEGFLLDRHQAPMGRQALLALRVAKVGREYWARWGSSVRSQASRTKTPSRRARSQ